MQKILIVEDEPAYVRLLSDKLKGNYQILTAVNGKIGLEIAKQQQPDLILLDHIMPEMDGMTMLAELRKDPYGKIAKVIVLTNLEANDAIIVRAAKSQPAYYFVKSDIALDELVAKINNLLEKQLVDSPPKNT